MKMKLGLKQIVCCLEPEFSSDKEKVETIMFLFDGLEFPKSMFKVEEYVKKRCVYERAPV